MNPDWQYGEIPSAPPRVIDYAKAFEIAQCTFWNARRRKNYRDGVVRAAALSAVDAVSEEDFIKRMCDAFYAHEICNDRWDGSIA